MAKRKKKENGSGETPPKGGGGSPSLEEALQEALGGEGEPKKEPEVSSAEKTEERAEPADIGHRIKQMIAWRGVIQDAGRHDPAVTEYGCEFDFTHESMLNLSRKDLVEFNHRHAAIRRALYGLGLATPIEKVRKVRRFIRQATDEELSVVAPTPEARDKLRAMTEDDFRRTTLAATQFVISRLEKPATKPAGRTNIAMELFASSMLEAEAREPAAADVPAGTEAPQPVVEPELPTPVPIEPVVVEPPVTATVEVVTVEVARVTPEAALDRELERRCRALEEQLRELGDERDSAVAQGQAAEVARQGLATHVESLEREKADLQRQLGDAQTAFQSERESLAAQVSDLQNKLTKEKGKKMAGTITPAQLKKDLDARDETLRQEIKAVKDDLTAQVGKLPDQFRGVAETLKPDVEDIREMARKHEAEINGLKSDVEKNAKDRPKRGWPTSATIAALVMGGLFLLTLVGAIGLGFVANTAMNRTALPAPAGQEAMDFSFLDD